MGEILFYHLERSPLEKALPILIEKCLERSWRVIIETENQVKSEIISEILWTYRDDSFLPHLIVGENDKEIEKEQIILITWQDENPNNAHIRFFVDGAIVRYDKQYERLVYLFNGHNSEEVEQARKAWKELSQNNKLTYWQQNNNGVWQKMSETEETK